MIDVGRIGQQVGQQREQVAAIVDGPDVRAAAAVAVHDEGAVLRVYVEEIALQVGPTDECAAVVLAILVYSYATGCFLSEEIEDSLEKQFVTASLIGFRDARPSTILRQFRRAHRREIEECLASVLQFALARGNLGRDFRGEANARVLRAIEADFWASDDD